MLEVPEAEGDAAAEFDDPVDGLRAAFARAAGVEPALDLSGVSTRGLGVSVLVSASRPPGVTH